VVWLRIRGSKGGREGGHSLGARKVCGCTWKGAGTGSGLVYGMVQVQVRVGKCVPGEACWGAGEEGAHINGEMRLISGIL
jgi:hypothetical protein